MRISDVIASYIMDTLASSEGTALLSRSELAERFNCVPSQINYVLMTRFSPEHGYFIESRRGGGGFIRISRVEMTRDILIMHVVNSIGDYLDAQIASAFLTNMLASEVINREEGELLAAAVSDNALSSITDKNARNKLRADILKRCLLTLA